MKKLLTRIFIMVFILIIFSNNPSVSVLGQEMGPDPTVPTLTDDSSRSSIVSYKILGTGDNLIHGFIYDNGYLWASTRTSQIGRAH
ncbi:MAG: hypothetical protein K0B14_16475, partial [Anaerolineaceae bacterium]|nr:hypothetical protein [Anaerolineaceae bacterium]